MKKIFGFLAAATLLTLSACEDSTTEPSSEPEVSAVESCSLLGGIFCSETPTGEIPTSQCGESGGVFSANACPAGELLKCEGQDIPGRDDIKSVAYVYDATWVATIEGLASEAGSDNSCDGIPLLLAQFAQ